MNFTFLALILLGITLSTPCKAQTVEETPPYSNVSSNPVSISTEAPAVVAPYEVSLNVVPLSEAEGNDKPFNNNDITITLQKNQDLIVHVITPDNQWRNKDSLTTDNTKTAKSSLRAIIDTANWGSWNNAILDGKPPLEEDLALCTSGNPLNFYFRYKSNGGVNISFQALPKVSYIAPSITVKIK